MIWYYGHIDSNAVNDIKDDYSEMSDFDTRNNKLAFTYKPKKSGCLYFFSPCGGTFTPYIKVDNTLEYMINSGDFVADYSKAGKINPYRRNKSNGTFIDLGSSSANYYGWIGFYVKGGSEYHFETYRSQYNYYFMMLLDPTDTM